MGAYTSYQPLEPVQEKEKNRIKDEDSQVNPPPGMVYPMTCVGPIVDTNYVSSEPV